MIGFDNEFQSEPSRASQVVLPIPENAREIPCDLCQFEKECAVRMTECVAFRQWSASGDYMDKDMGRLRRACK